MSGRACIALLRGINVGGNTRLPMKDLTAWLHDLGLENVRTYLQSGNVVFSRPRKSPNDLARRIEHEIGRRCGFEPAVLLMDVARLEAVVRDNPFPEAVAEPKSLHANFLAVQPPQPDLGGLESIRRDSERFLLGDRVLYVHAPEGIGRSKLAARAEKLLGVPMTGRNWRSVTSVLELAYAL